MKRLVVPVVCGMLLVSTGIFAQAMDALIVKNIGLIVDTPFLHQPDLPFESEIFGTRDATVVTYEYNDRGLPTVIRYADLTTRNPFVDVDVTYLPDGQIASLVYTSYDPSDISVFYVETFEFSDYGRTGPTRATMENGEGTFTEMRLSYDENGRLIEVQEDNAFGEGLFRQDRYVWALEREESLPHAIEVHFPLSGEVERYRYLYDAEGRLQGLHGVSFPETAPYDTTSVAEWYFYQTHTLDELFTNPGVPHR